MKTLLFLLLAALLAGCATQQTPKRYAWVTGLRPDKAAHDVVREHGRKK